MSIMHASSTVANAAGAVGFSPTIFGRINANGLVAEGRDQEFAVGAPGPNASCDVAIWVIQTSDNCYIRVGINDDPNLVNTWYNTSGTSQGDPGNTNTTGATVYELGEQCDTVTIDHTETTDSGSPTFTNPPSGGTYTDNSSFSPTTDTKYGREIQVLDVSSTSLLAEEGTCTFAVTFAKTGYDNATVTFSIKARALANWEP
jgi:hypothetical protein